MRLSVIIPTLNESGNLRTTLHALRSRCPVAEIICVDGGSNDNTVEIAKEAGAMVLNAERGRGRQLQAGALAASGDVLWFLHADTEVKCDAAAQIANLLGDPRVVAGNFRLRFAGNSGGARFLNMLYPRLALLGLRYGDSGIFVRRDVYERVGGFRPLPIFEDLDLLRRVRRAGRVVTAGGLLCTSSRRFESRSFAPVFARWAGLQVLYWLGWDPASLGRWYHPEKAPLQRS